jgi:hypothetical protein
MQTGGLPTIGIPTNKNPSRRDQHTIPTGQHTAYLAVLAAASWMVKVAVKLRFRLILLP